MNSLNESGVSENELVPPPALRTWAAHNTDPRVPVTTAARERDYFAMLLAIAGHDLCQPLQVITGAHDALAGTLEQDSQRQALARAEAARARMAAMLRQIVEALHLYKAVQACLRETVPLGPLLDDLFIEFALPASLKGVGFAVLPCEDKVLSQPLLLLGMLRNLVRNAIDYTPCGGRVVVACDRRGPELRIEVQDTGTGIHPQDLSQIFDAFQRADNTRPDGLGLGLYIVKMAADFLGHRIDVRSAVAGGSCFSIIARCDDFS